MSVEKQVLVFGATGNVGGAATRELLKRGWRVRAVTRNPEGDKAKALANLGAEVVQGDMADKPSLEAAFDGIERVFSVQNPWISGFDGEILQGKLVSEVAQASGVEHLVYSSAGPGESDTGVPHFQSKVEIEAHMKKLGIPFSVIRPRPFMELLPKQEFYPAMGVWGAEPKILGWDTPIPWVAVRDIGITAANLFDAPKKWIGKDIVLFGDVKTLSECRSLFEKVTGKKPFRLPLPLWLFRRMAGNELILMWKWMSEWIEEEGPEGLWKLVESARKVCPELLDLESWLKLIRASNS
jgi:uncharacterized protein YbjT (DUF2867 family)